MTKKNYEATAARFADKIHQAQVLELYHSDVDERGAARAWRTAEWRLIELAEDLATDFKQDNPRFDHDRFAEACGYMGSTHKCTGVA